jgi:sulfite reductase (NADPH) flavoprotein alpha-component
MSGQAFMRAAAIPKTAPFGEEEIDLLNRVVGRASPTQRAWLAGFLAGVDASAAPSPPAGLTAAVEPLTIVFASESGNCEHLAGDIAKLARKKGLKPAIIDMADLEAAELAKTKRLVVIAATWGEGEPPARAARAYRALMSEGAPRLDGVEFAVLALGDTAYAEFCAVGKALDERLAALGGKRAADRLDCDLDFAAPAADWIDRVVGTFAPKDAISGTVIEVDFARTAAAAKIDIVEAEIIEHVNLNSSRSEKETIHLALAFDGGAPAYEPGDSLELYPQNDPAEVDELLRAASLGTDQGLREELIKSRDIATLSLKNLDAYASITEHQSVKALLASGEAREWIAGRQLFDLLTTFPVAITPEQIRTLTRPLAPRAYSIASSRREVADEAHLLVSAVRYQSRGRARKGVASNHVAERLKRGNRVRVKLRPNRHFALPAPDRDIIMVGPGTGVAPFRAFVQERRATAARGRNCYSSATGISRTISSINSNGRKPSGMARSRAWT